MIRFFYLKTYCPKMDKEVEFADCDTCRHNEGYDDKGKFINCGWGDSDDRGNEVIS